MIARTNSAVFQMNNLYGGADLGSDVRAARGGMAGSTRNHKYCWQNDYVTQIHYREAYIIHNANSTNYLRQTPHYWIFTATKNKLYQFNTYNLYISWFNVLFAQRMMKLWTTSL